VCFILPYNRRKTLPYNIYTMILPYNICSYIYMYYGYVALDEILHNCIDLDYNLSNRTYEYLYRCKATILLKKEIFVLYTPK